MSLRQGFLAGCLVLALSGCSKLRPKPETQYVYVTSKQTYLRDRVAAVSNRTATVENGAKLQVLEKGRRFYRVQTPKGEQGWIDERAVATQEIFDQFETLGREHQNDSVVANAVVRDDVYLHTKPGRDTDRLFRLTEGEKLKLLRRATLPKPLPPGQRPPVKPVTTAAGTTKDKTGAQKEAAPAEPAPPIMEDWWLVRDSRGDTGWLYSRMMDVDVPDSIGRYSEGQRIVGAYILTKVNDPDAPQDDKNIPEYVTVLSPYKAGLPYDFNQVRVFTWNVKKHRYETAFRERNIEGYLPVEIKMAKDPYAKNPAGLMEAPTFSFKVLSADAPIVIPDPVTGAIVPGKTNLKTYRLEGSIVRRIVDPTIPPPDDAHPDPMPVKKKKAAAVSKKPRRRR
ncbi:SH3 domain-containing protein [Edaphobacter albus]|uniref:SH3 domain-containing protein n=1 Tax=Edaphobacter sp. 4G125 TaxID=2763071 RepID=UPI0016467A18|nr:SH3 domain-containing protein [Edaphobacter sp. 4G125]QNI37929.1 SH3 domain-containing protein [Edaphobacter sp. 4G125]